MRKRYISAVTTAESAMEYDITCVGILIAIIAAMPNCETWLTDFWDEIATAVALKAAGRINERD